MKQDLFLKPSHQVKIGVQYAKEVKHPVCSTLVLRLSGSTTCHRSQELRVNVSSAMNQVFCSLSHEQGRMPADHWIPPICNKDCPLILLSYRLPTCRNTLLPDLQLNTLDNQSYASTRMTLLYRKLEHSTATHISLQARRCKLLA